MLDAPTLVMTGLHALGVVQGALLGPPGGVPQLPAPPLVPRLLLENPISLVVILAVLGLGALVIFRRAGRLGRGLAVAGVMLALAGAVLTLAGIVQTDRERVIARGEALIRAAARADIDAIRPMLDQDVSVRAAHLHIAGRDAVLNEISVQMRAGAPVRDVRILSSTAIIDGPRTARSQHRVRTVHAITGFPALSWWRLTWRKDPDAWRLVQADALYITGVGPPR